MSKMNPEIKARWVAALRSGEYMQGAGQLRDGNSFCCLGVLCDLHAKEYGLDWAASGASYQGASSALPESVCDWAELSGEEGGKVEIGKESDWLAAHNDGYGVKKRTFAEIADAIEQQL